jgi:hypothetical protein
MATQPIETDMQSSPDHVVFDGPQSSPPPFRSVIKAPKLKRWRFPVRTGRHEVRVYDQPGYWMKDGELEKLQADIWEIAEDSMDQVPTYGVFSGERKSFENRVIGIMYEKAPYRPVGFTALVYMPMPVYTDNDYQPVIHFGLTMIKKSCRGQRLQSPIFEKLFYLPVINQKRVKFIITNIAASPAGIGAMSDYFLNCFPNYRMDTERTPMHLNAARNALKWYRDEFGCSWQANFEEDTFVVRGSNDPDAGGAFQFIREDPVSRYKKEECNDFCGNLLHFPEGDELFQVSQLNLIKGLIGVMKRQKVSKKKKGHA